MTRRYHPRTTARATRNSPSEALAHPNEVFGRPEYVINHPSLSHQEKRINLLSWVRDELVNEQLAAEALPELKPHSRIDAVLDGLSRFDTSAAGEYLSAVSSIRRRRDAR